jgi:hypothetical protein
MHIVEIADLPLAFSLVPAAQMQVFNRLPGWSGAGEPSHYSAGGCRIGGKFQLSVALDPGVPRQGTIAIRGPNNVSRGRYAVQLPRMPAAATAQVHWQPPCPHPWRPPA